MPTKKLTKRTVDAAQGEAAEYTFWDTELKGFGLRVQPTGAKTYVVKYRAGRGRNAPTKRLTIGRHGSPWTPDRARMEARRLLIDAASGDDPAANRAAERKAMSVAELCDLYLKEGCTTKKASTLAVDVGRIERHIKPVLGRRRAMDVTRADVVHLLRCVASGETKTDLKTRTRGRARVTGGKYAANRVVSLFGAILTFACERSLLEANPAGGVKKFPEPRRERFLSQSELQRLGTAITGVAREGVNPMAIAIIRLLIFTGARRSEIECLRWPEFDAEHSCLHLADSKSGRKVVPLSSLAVKIIESQPRVDGTEYVFPATSGEGRYRGVSKIWRRIRKCAGLDDLRLHDLRHTFASVSISAGVPMAVIGKILGHADQRMTNRYAHLADDPVYAGAEKVADVLSKRLGDSIRVQDVVSLVG